MIAISLDVTRIDKARIKAGKERKDGSTPRYADFVLFDKPDDRGNDGFVAQSVSKEERESGVRGPIVGNWKTLGGSKPAPARKPAPKDPDLDAESDVPF